MSDNDIDVDGHSPRAQSDDESAQAYSIQRGSVAFDQRTRFTPGQVVALLPSEARRLDPTGEKFRVLGDAPSDAETAAVTEDVSADLEPDTDTAPDESQSATDPNEERDVRTPESTPGTPTFEDAETTAEPTDEATASEGGEFDYDAFAEQGYKARAEAVRSGEVDDHLDEIAEKDGSDTVTDAVDDRQDELDTSGGSA